MNVYFFTSAYLMLMSVNPGCNDLLYLAQSDSRQRVWTPVPLSKTSIAADGESEGCWKEIWGWGRVNNS